MSNPMVGSCSAGCSAGAVMSHSFGRVPTKKSKKVKKANPYKDYYLLLKELKSKKRPKKTQEQKDRQELFKELRKTKRKTKRTRSIKTKS